MIYFLGATNEGRQEYVRANDPDDGDDDIPTF